MPPLAVELEDDGVDDGGLGLEGGAPFLDDDDDDSATALTGVGAIVAGGGAANPSGEVAVGETIFCSPGGKTLGISLPCNFLVMRKMATENSSGVILPSPSASASPHILANAVCGRPLLRNRSLACWPVIIPFLGFNC